jgi:hypothetical protein
MVKLYGRLKSGLEVMPEVFIGGWQLTAQKFLHQTLTQILLVDLKMKTEGQAFMQLMPFQVRRYGTKKLLINVSRKTNQLVIQVYQPLFQQQMG